jgi:hypothetical protein
VAKKRRDEVLSMPAAALATPPPAVDRAARAAFKKGAPPPATVGHQRSDVDVQPLNIDVQPLHGGRPPRRKRGLVRRADGTALRHVAAYLPPALYQRLSAYADDHDQTVSEAVVDAVRRLLDAQDAS